MRTRFPHGKGVSAQDPRVRAAGELFDLPGLYRTAREALELMTDERFHGEPVCSVAQLRTPLLLKNLEARGDLIPIALRPPCRPRP